ncbi:MAG: hypothetical protein ISQ13_03890 [Candidatus Margulisbacteria bacterium]|nr:hypothetical protein [Candidatus Margulisiibacteriota bacterium]
MRLFQVVVIFLFVGIINTHAVTTNINVQFLLGDADNGVFNGNYHITFGLYSTTNVSVNDALWKETHELVVTEGSVSQLLGTKVPLSYHALKSDQLYMGLTFDEISDNLFVPLISVPASVVSKYSLYAQEIEFTSDWMKINTANHQVGIGITQNLTVPFEVVGTAKVTTLDVTGEIKTPDGYNIERLNYFNLVNLDDYSLSPHDNLDIPTVDVVYVTNERLVGVGFYDATANINEHFHVSGNLKVDHGAFFGSSDIQLVGTSNLDSIVDTNGHQLLWDSNQGVFRAGAASGETWFLDNNGKYSVAFGQDNLVRGTHAFAAGRDNSISQTAPYGVVGGGKSNDVEGRVSGVFSGEDNTIHNTGTGDEHGFMAIAGGRKNDIKSSYGFVGGGESNTIETNSPHSVVLGGKTNQILNGSAYSSILGGQDNKVYGQFSVALGQNAQIGRSGDSTDGVFMFSDATRSADTNNEALQNSYSNQFIVYATNGVLMGLTADGGFDHKQVMMLDEFDPVRYYPPRANCNGEPGCIESPNSEGSFISNGVEHEAVKDHTLRVAGDIVAANEDGRLGYLVGDGRFITNISSLWLNDEPLRSIYTETKRVGIGAVNDVSSPRETFLYIKGNSQVGYHPTIHIESENGGQLHVGVLGDPGHGVIHATNSLVFQQGESPVIDVANLSNNGDFIVNTKLGVGIDVPTHNLHVVGDAKITGVITNNDGILSNGPITTNAVPGFVGDGSLLTDVPVYYMSPQGVGPGDELFKQLMMNTTGKVGIGPVTADIKALLHVSSEIGNSDDDVHLRLEDFSNGLNSNNYTTFKSTSKLDITFYTKNTGNPVIFSINSSTANATTASAPDALVNVTKRGHVGILTLPHSGNALSVSGNVAADTFEGDGALVTDVQLDVPQEKSVIFNKGVTVQASNTTMASLLTLTPYTRDLAPETCSDDMIGALYTTYVNANNTGEITLCMCTNDGVPPISLTGEDATTCQNSN